MRWHRIIISVLAVAALSGCVADKDGWQQTLSGASDTAALHLTCVGGGIADVTIGTLEGGVEGATAGLTISAEIVNGQVDNEAAWVFIGSGTAIGGVIGAGAGLGGEVVQIPETYGTCLKTRGPDFETPERMPKT